MGSWLLYLVFLLAINTVISITMQLIIPNYYLASMMTSLIIAFLYGILGTPFDRAHFYKQRDFYVRFLGSAIIFLLLDCLTFLM